MHIGIKGHVQKQIEGFKDAYGELKEELKNYPLWNSVNNSAARSIVFYLLGEVFNGQHCGNVRKLPTINYAQVPTTIAPPLYGPHRKDTQSKLEFWDQDSLLGSSLEQCNFIAEGRSPRSPT